MANDIFDAHAYFERLTKENKLCQENGYTFGICSGPENIQYAMEQFRKAKNFVMVDDTTDQNTHSRGVGYYKLRVYTVFILAQYRWDDMKERKEKLLLCREIFRQFQSRIIFDWQNRTFGDMLEYVDMTRILSKEFGRWTMNGVTGLYFTLQNDEPEELCYNSDQWLTT